MNPIDCILSAAAVLCLLGLVGVMDMRDEQRLAEHEAQRARIIAAQRAEIERKSADWNFMFDEGQRMTGFPEVARK